MPRSLGSVTLILLFVARCGNLAQPIPLPVSNALLVVACNTAQPTSGNASSATVDPTHPCGFWLIEADRQEVTKVVDFQSPVDGSSSGLTWLLDGKRFLFQQQPAFSTEATTSVFFFDGHTVNAIRNGYRTSGAMVSPDGHYFVADVCTASNIDPGDKYFIYDAETGAIVGAMDTGAAAMQCVSGQEKSSQSYTLPLADGSTWVLSSPTTYPDTSLIIKICQKDGSCVVGNWASSAPHYTSSQYQVKTSGDAVMIYNTASQQTGTYHFPNMRVLDTAWSPGTQ